MLTWVMSLATLWATAFAVGPDAGAWSSIVALVLCIPTLFVSASWEIRAQVMEEARSLGVSFEMKEISANRRWGLAALLVGGLCLLSVGLHFLAWFRSG